MTQVTQGALTILNAHTATPTVFWNGIKVEGVQALDVDVDPAHSRVRITLTEDPRIVEMQAAGILIRRKP
jgi:hypothetical protein